MPFHQYFESEAYMNETELWQKDFTKELTLWAASAALTYWILLIFLNLILTLDLDPLSTNQLTTSWIFWNCIISSNLLIVIRKNICG